MTDKFEKFMRESNWIEGELSRVASPRSRDVGLIGALHPRDIEAMKYMYERASQGMPMEEGHLLHIHGILSEHREDMKWKGEYRQCEVYIGGREGVTWPNVPKTMQDFFTFWKLRDVWNLHCTYEKIHPFEDLNGRTGRIVWAWKMLEKERDPFQMPFLQYFYYQTLSNYQR